MICMSSDCALRSIPEKSEAMVPMHPDDYAGLLAWVRAKEGERKQAGISSDEE